MFYPELWSGESNRTGERSKREGIVCSHGNGYRGDDGRMSAETVYEEAKRNSEVRGDTARNSF